MDPTGCLTYDWVHNCLQDGMLTVEVQLFLAACEPHGLTRPFVKSALADKDWSFPSQHSVKSKQLHRVFDPYRDTADAHRIKCSASELLGLYGLLRYIVAAHLPRVPELLPQLASFDAACSVMDCLTAAKRGVMTINDSAAALRAVLERHMTLHLAAYGDEGIRPKHHWNMDIPSQLVRDQLMLDTFVIERTHLTVKQVADDVKNTHRFERSVMAGVLNITLKPTASGGWSHALLGNVREMEGGILTSARMRVHGLNLAIGDVVMYREICGKVTACLLVGGILHAVVDSFTKEGNHTLHWGRWRMSGEQAVWIAASLHHCMAWRPALNDTVLVLR